MIHFKDYVEEEVAANSVAGGGVDLSPNGMPKNDKRKKNSITAMYRRSLGLGHINGIIERRKKASA